MSELVNRDFAKRVMDRMNRAVAEVAAEFNLRVKPARITYNEASSELTVRTIFSAVDKEAEQRAEFARAAFLYRLKPDDYGKEFSYGGKRYRLVGVSSRGTRYPIHAQSLSDGKGYKLPHTAVEGLIGGAHAGKDKA